MEKSELQAWSKLEMKAKIGLKAALKAAINMSEKKNYGKNQKTYLTGAAFTNSS